MKIALRNKIFYVLVCASLMVVLALGAQPLTSALAGPACYSATTTTFNAWPGSPAPGGYTYGTAGMSYSATVVPTGGPGLVTGTVTFIADPDGIGPAGGIVIAGPVPLNGSGQANLTTVDGRELDAFAYGGLYAQYNGDSTGDVYCASNAWSAGVFTVAPKVLTVNLAGATMNITREYNNSNWVGYYPLPPAGLVGVIAGDDVYLTDLDGTMADDHVGVAKPVTEAFDIAGADAGNYTLTQPDGYTATITARPARLVGLTASNKVYDSTTAATCDFTGVAFQAGDIYPSDSVTLIITPPLSCTFGDKNVGTGKAVNVNAGGYTLGPGLDNTDYTLVQPVAYADITPYNLDAGGVIANDKFYDGYNNVLGYTLGGYFWITGPLGGDPSVLCHDGVNFGTFASANAGLWNVTTAGFYVGTAGCAGPDGNYTITQPTVPQASIWPIFANIWMANKYAPPFWTWYHTYNGLPWVADLRSADVYGVSPLAGAFSNVIYAGAGGTVYGPTATPPVNAGLYDVWADFTPVDTTNYNTSVGAYMGQLWIDKSWAWFGCNNDFTPFTGAPQPADLWALTWDYKDLLGTFSNVRYNGSATVPTAVGEYQVYADFTPNDPANYYSYVNEYMCIMHITQTPSITLAVTNSPVTYDGSAHTAAVSIVSSGGVPGWLDNIRTGGSFFGQTDAGTYAVLADWIPDDPDHYSEVLNINAGNFVINKATPTATLVVTNSPVFYDGAYHAAAVTIAASSVPGHVENILTGGAASQYAVGTYAVTANFVPNNGNYNTLIALSAGNFSIVNAPAEELLLNGGFNLYDTRRAKVPTSWIASGFVAGDGKTTVRDEGAYAIRMKGGRRMATKSLSQEILVNGIAGEVFTFSITMKGSSIPVGGTCQASVDLYNGTTWVQKSWFTCPTGTFGWTDFSDTFTATGAYTKAIVTLTYQESGGFVWFDNASLLK